MEPLPTDSFKVRPLSELEVPGFDALLNSSREEGFRFLERLRAEFASGENRFQREGEGLWGVFGDAQLIGIAGLNRLPEEPLEGRVRRVYVAPEWRRRGVGRALIKEVISSARPWAERLVLRTDDPRSALFYVGLGFKTVEGMPAITHAIELR